MYNDPVGTLQSPGQPVPFPNGANCTYYIAVNPAYIINLQFLTFTLEEAPDGNNCNDYVEIFDGDSVKATSFGR